MKMSSINFYEGQPVEYRWTKTGKWHVGRIKKIEFLLNMISNYQIEKFIPNAKMIDWKTIIEGIDRGQNKNFIDTEGKDIYKYEDAWVPVKWFSINYIRPLIIER